MDYSAVFGNLPDMTKIETAGAINILRKQQLSTLESLAHLLLRELELLKKTEYRIDEHSVREGEFSLYHETQNFEAAMIRSALIQVGGVQCKAAKLLGLKVTTLNEKIKRYKIDLSNPNLAES